MPRRLLLLLTLLAGCAPSDTSRDSHVTSAAPTSATAAPISDSPLTIVHYLELGERQVKSHLTSTSDPETRKLAAVLDTARKSVVRIRVNYGRTPASFQTDHGSGFFVQGGRFVVTAGHVLESLAGDSAAEVVVTCTDGRTFHARPIHREFSGRAGIGADLGVLEIVDANEASMPSLSFGTATAGAIAAVLGYPSRIGIGSSGSVAGDDHVANNPLLPLVSVCRVRNVEGRVVLEPVAGCVPEGGASGGPVIDAQGNVIAVETSVSRTQAGEALKFTINAIPIAGVEAAINASHPR